MSYMNRRDFLKSSSALLAASTLPLSLIEIAYADTSQNFTFAYISDAHIQHIKGKEFVRNWDRGLIRAVAETNLMDPKPDFVMFGGDMGQLGKREEINHGLELLAPLTYQKHFVIGEHDYYLDLGEYWQKIIGPLHYSFDHKGVHFVVLNSILTYDDWTYNRWPSAEERMLQMADLDNPNGSPFMVGEKQRAWLKQDLAKINHATPLVVFSHSPLQKIYRGWNFWTEDAEQVQALLAPFKKVTVLYGHVHQIQYNQIGTISFHSAMATAWPWPYPATYAQAQSFLPKLTVEMNRADPFFERDATGWQYIDVYSGHVREHYQLAENTRRTVAFNPKTGQPEDTRYQAPDRRLLSQNHY
ncbi:MAG: metallophosphoesterase [Gammaproteobacteria bacterium]|nr:metallophosphoesterase [Gammaproteobacteria bacterium]